MDDKYSSIKKIVTTVRLPLPPALLANEYAAFKEILDSWKSQYVPRLQGIVVDYKKVSLVSRSGFIGLNSKHPVYFNVRATFYLFTPNVGDIVKGTINRISNEHICCIVRDVINVSIPLTESTPKELSQFMFLGQDVLFRITHFDFVKKVIRVNGEIDAECLRLMSELIPEVRVNESDASEVSDEECVTPSTSKRRKRTKSYEPPNLDDDNSFISNLLQELQVKKEADSNESSSTPVEKKSKKRKRGSASSLEVSNADEEVTPKKKAVNSESSTTPFEKKSKKLKRDSMSSLEPCNAYEETIPKKKKSKSHRDSVMISSLLSCGSSKDEPQTSISSKNLVNGDVPELSTAIKRIKKEKVTHEEASKASLDSESKSKKRKRESSQSEVDSAEKPKKKKRDKHLKSGAKSDKSKSSKKKSKLLASGDILKKDKKKSHKSKKSKGDKKDSKKSKKKDKKHKKKEKPG